MSYLVVGLSHHQTPVHVLERATVTAEQMDEALADVLRAEPINEAMILSTCNRTEVYAHVERFHGGLDSIVEWLSDRMEVDADELAGFVQVEYAEEAVEHMMRVASGLESMVVGEPQILGQLRTAYLEAIDRDAVGRNLHGLAQHALRVGKRIQSDLGLSDVGRNIAAVAIELAGLDAGGLRGRNAVILGAGAMATLAGNALRAHGVRQIEIINRSESRARALAAKVDARTRALEDLDDALRTADVVVTAMGSSPGAIDVADLAGCGPTTVVDLALPTNVTEAAGALPHVNLIGLAQIQLRADELNVAIDGAHADVIIQDEVASFIAKQRSAAVAPTIAALRDRAQRVVDAEMRRLKNRIADVDDRALGEIEYTIERIVDKMLHAPSVKIRESAGTVTGEAYAEALRMLFDVGDAADDPSGAMSTDVQQSVTTFSGPEATA